MPTVLDSVDAAIEEVSRARKLLSNIKTSRVHKQDDLDAIKSLAYAWFKGHRPVIAEATSNLDLTQTDTHYQAVLDCTSKRAEKSKYLEYLQQVRSALLNLRAEALAAPSGNGKQTVDDLAPDFTPLVGNEEMRAILTRRWHECRKCVNAEAHLAAIVMMGGLLEALFVARANKMADKALLIAATSAPKDKSTGKTQNYQEWMLDSYIKVGRELAWITESARDVADVLKEYRNYIHPEKERRHGVVLALNDSSMFWQVTKALARQLLMSATATS